MKTRTPEQSIVSCETQWTQPWPRVQSQVDIIHFVRSTGAIVSNPHLHTVKAALRKGAIVSNPHLHTVKAALRKADQEWRLYGQCNGSYCT